MTITEWFARAVAAGLMPEWENIITNMYSTGKARLHDCNSDKYIETPSGVIEKFELIIELRKDGKDLYQLEWRKPTESDVGKMCWGSNFYTPKNIYLIEYNQEIHKFVELNHECFILADHGRTAPTEQDFKRIYGEKND